MAAEIAQKMRNIKEVIKTKDNFNHFKVFSS
jgi:hypothetical protein